MSHALSILAAVGAAALLLGACGGGGDDPAPPGPDAVPASASASPEAFTQYAAMLPADDRREPLKVDELVPPTSETAEPAPVAR